MQPSLSITQSALSCPHDDCSKGESYVTLLNFVTGQSNAAAQGTAIALGTYHTVGLLCMSQEARPEYAMYAMGRGFHGQLGLERFENQDEPQRVRGVRAGAAHLLHARGWGCSQLLPFPSVHGPP
jgi:hypothetical protein